MRRWPSGATPSAKDTVPHQGDRNQSLVLPAFFTRAHLAFAKADNLARAAALILRLGCLTGFSPFFAARIFAHRAFAAARILAIPAADIFRFWRAGPGGSTATLRMRFNSPCSDWIFS